MAKWQYRIKGSSSPAWRDVTEKPGLVFQPTDSTYQLEFRKKPKRTDAEVRRDALNYVTDASTKARQGNYVGIGSVLAGIEQILRGRY